MEPKPHYFWDSDVAKWIEAVSYSLASEPDSTLEAMLDEVIDLIVSAQQPDGYLNIYFTVVEPENRWANLRDCHELYCAGHLMEAAVAHYQATGKRNFLDTMCRYADYIDSVFGVEEGKKRGYCGHEEIELALMKLYHATGNERYLRLSKYFVDERGNKPYYYDVEAEQRGENPQSYWAKDYSYCQAHIPVREMSEVTGHAVRAMYLYSAMADLAGETGDERLKAACERIWEDVCLRKMYITGGIGPSRHNEGFTTPYDLPNDTAYAETCAAIGLVFWNHRLLQLDCDGKYADVMERALYNGVISGVSLDGNKFFYENPLGSLGTHHRQDWFGCACCPPNVARILASVGEYIYSSMDDGIAVHLYVQGEMQTDINGMAVTLKQQTRYPWDGQVTLTIEQATAAAYTLRLRIPGWCREHTLQVNGQVVEPAIDKGYACITRTWQSGDTITLELTMPVEVMAANPAVPHDRGLVALQRGPLVYCLEGVDHPASVRRLTLPVRQDFTAQFHEELLDGVAVIAGEAVLLPEQTWDGKLYRPIAAEHGSRIPIRAVPYYTWDNREPGEMVVWLPKAPVEG